MHKASSRSFSSRCQYRVRSSVRCDEPAGVLAQRPDLRRRHEAEPQQPHLGQPRDPLRVGLVGLRRPGRFRRLGGFTSCTSSPAASRSRTRCASSRWCFPSRSAPRRPPSARPARPRSPVTVAPVSQTLEYRLPLPASGGRRRQIIPVAFAMSIPATFSLQYRKGYRPGSAASALAPVVVGLAGVFRVGRQEHGRGSA